MEYQMVVVARCEEFVDEEGPGHQKKEQGVAELRLCKKKKQNRVFITLKMQSSALKKNAALNVYEILTSSHVFIVDAVTPQARPGTSCFVGVAPKNKSGRGTSCNKSGRGQVTC
jgi:hypothetical protein